MAKSDNSKNEIKYKLNSFSIQFSSTIIINYLLKFSDIKFSTSFTEFQSPERNFPSDIYFQDQKPYFEIHAQYALITRG